MADIRPAVLSSVEGIMGIPCIGQLRNHTVPSSYQNSVPGLKA